MRVLVCGGRAFDDRRCMDRALGSLRHRGITTIITGGAHGADAYASAWARRNGLAAIVYRADWHAHGRAAGPLRNTHMIAEGKPDLVIAFPGGRGTADCIAKAKATGIEVVEIQPEHGRASAG